ncbi:MAG: hypothetical protein GX275_06995 [Clostridiales bacterium]|nr:hypothetical protein [Clostridiales bacterium]
MRKILINLKSNLLALLFTILGIELIFQAIYGEYNIGFVISIIILTTIFFCFFDKVKEAGNKGPLLYIPLALILIFLAVLLIYSSSGFNGGITFRMWIFNGGTKNGDILGYIMAALIIITFLFSSMFYYFLVVIIRMPVLLLLFFVVAILNIKGTYVEGNFVLYAFLFSFLLVFFENTKVKCLPEEAVIKSRKRHITSAGVIALTIMFAIALVIPKIKFPPIGVMEDLKAALNANGVNGEGKNFSVGDSDSRSINESNNFNDNSVLFSFVGDNPKYLISQTFTTYNNEKWVNESNENKSLIKINSKERELVIDRTVKILKDTEKLRVYYQEVLDIKNAEVDDTLKRNIKLTAEKEDVKAIPHPANTYLAYVNENKENIYFNNRDALFKEDLFRTNESINIQYISDNPEENSIQDLILKKFTDGKLISVYDMYKEEEYIDSFNSVRKIYRMNEIITSNPIDERISDLAEEIAKEGDSDSVYDKAKKIESYFKNGEYTYNLTLPKKASGYRDYIDYFILEGKTGYCVQFATAMTLMCREIGIPARYVEGYVVEESDKNQDGSYNVVANKGHAFVEVYIPGYGWKIFDPTPGRFDDNSENDGIDNDNNSNKKEININKNLIIGIIIGMVSIIIVVTTTILYFIFTKRKRFLKKIRRKQLDEGLELIIHNSIGELKKAGMTPNKMETLLKFATRVDIKYRFGFKDIINIYYLYKYNNISVNKDELEKAIQVDTIIYEYFNNK